MDRTLDVDKSAQTMQRFSLFVIVFSVVAGCQGVTPVVREPAPAPREALSAVAIDAGAPDSAPLDADRYPNDIGFRKIRSGWPKGTTDPKKIYSRDTIRVTAVLADAKAPKAQFVYTLLREPKPLAAVPMKRDKVANQWFVDFKLKDGDDDLMEVVADIVDEGAIQKRAKVPITPSFIVKLQYLRKEFPGPDHLVLRDAKEKEVGKFVVRVTDLDAAGYATVVFHGIDLDAEYSLIRIYKDVPSVELNHGSFRSLVRGD